MFLLTLSIAAAAITTQVADPVMCPVMGSPASETGAIVDYKGIRYQTCCPGCDKTFMKDPVKVLSDEKIKGKTVGVFLFDPVAKVRFNAKKGDEYVDYNGTRFFFMNETNLAKFKEAPAQYATIPNKESLFCPVMKNVVPNYSQAFGYEDYEGVRYYICCAGCEKSFREDPSLFIKDAAKYIQTPKPIEYKPKASAEEAPEVNAEVPQKQDSIVAPT